MISDPQKTLMGIHQTELEILDEIDRVCRQYGLRYSLAYGTLIGAVRHKGFIPWDDDVDVMMPREDYEQFVHIWSSVAKEGFLLQDDTMYPDYPNNYAKIRKNHTTFLQFEAERTRSYQTGIYVDVFPGDRVAPAGIHRRIQYVFFAFNLLFNRGYPSGAGGLTGFVEKALLALLPKGWHSSLSLSAGRFSRRWNDDTSREFVFPSTIGACKRYYPSDLFDNLKAIFFEGKEYAAVRDTDNTLRIEYGDYMQLPPEVERVWKHHPIIVDFTHNYEELELEK